LPNTFYQQKTYISKNLTTACNTTKATNETGTQYGRFLN
jgi:hypothetical protein